MVSTGASGHLCVQRLASRDLDQITSEHIADFAANRQVQGKGLQVSTVNSNLRVLRRMLGLAVEWGELAGLPKVNLLRGERHRDRVVSSEEEKSYLDSAPEPLASIASILFDTGLRPDECFSLRWEYISIVNENGLLQVASGKTAAARRVIPMTPRVRSVLWDCWLAAGRPETGYVWPAETLTGHVDDETIRRIHLKALRESKVRPFVLHSLRHTFLTRLGAAGVDAWTLARIAGHSSIKVSARYVHPNEDNVQKAMSRLAGRHKTGHTEILALPADIMKAATASAR
jgi:integrase